MKNNIIAPPPSIKVACKNCGNRERFYLGKVKMNILGYFIYPSYKSCFYKPKASFVREKCSKCGCRKWEQDFTPDFRDYMNY